MREKRERKSGRRKRNEDGRVSRPRVTTESNTTYSTAYYVLLTSSLLLSASNRNGKRLHSSSST